MINKALTDYFRFLAIGTVVVVLALGYFFLIAPKITAVRSTEVTTRKNTESELQTQQAYLEDLKQSNQKFRSTFTEDQRREINAFIPSTSDFPSLLLTVENIVSQAQLTLDSISIGQVGQATAAATTPPAGGETTNGTATAQAATVSGISFKTQDVSISVSGGKSYDSFKNLLSLFESSRRLFDIISVGYSLKVDEQGGNAGSVWNLTLRTYYLPIQR